MAQMYPWPVGVLVTTSVVSLLFGLYGSWALWRTRRLLNVVPEMETRLETLTHSMSLLTDTTESCFKALSMQLQFMGSQNARPAQSSRSRATIAELPPNETNAKQAKQRRVVGAARRGDALAEIAAREDLSETEVALRLHVNREQARGAEAKRHGSLHS